MHDLFCYDKFEMLLTEVISGGQKATKSLSTKHSFFNKILVHISLTCVVYCILQIFKAHFHEILS